MYTDLKFQLHEACLLMQRCRVSSYYDAVMSVIDRERGIIAIKNPGDKTDLIDLTSDTFNNEFRDHIKIYDFFPSVRCIVHSHSNNVSIFADAGLDFKPYSLANKHYFGSNIPCVYRDTSHDIASAIADKYEEIGQTADTLPAVLVKSDGALLFGKNPISTADLSFILENNAKYAYLEEKYAMSPGKRFEILLKHNPAKKIKSEFI